MIRCSDLTRRYGDLLAVDSVSFTIEPGEIVGLLGHNGAGKTTIMKMMTGYLEPSSGVVEIGGKNLQNHRVELQSRLGYLPENTPVYPDMRVVEYLDYVAGLRQIPEAKRLEQVSQAMKRTEIIPRAGQKIGTLSRGFRQRVGVAQAILHSPEMLVLDEPTNGLDPSQIQEMRKLIKDLSAQSTVILSTHILQEVQAICDRVIIVRDGRIALDSKLEDIKQSNQVRLEVERESLPDQSKLREIDLVNAAEEIPSSNGTIHLRLDLQDVTAKSRAKLLEQLIQKGIKVAALQPEQRDLETVFREINQEAAN